MTLVRQRLEVPIPRKRRGSVANYEKVESYILVYMCFINII